MKNFEKILKPNNNKTFLIAEVSGNHQNNFLKLKKLVTTLVKAKPDAIKFQVYKPDTITLKTKKKDFEVEKNSPWKSKKYLYDLYDRAHTPWPWIEKLVRYLNKLKFPWLASVFDESSLMLMEKLKCPVYKVASPEITDVNLIEKIAKTRKPIILSTGVANIEDINLAIRKIKKFHKKIVILKCISEYPAKFEELNLRDIYFLKKKYGLQIGFSDHTIGNEAAILASYFGATVFEKHFKLDKDKKSIDEHFSMKVSDLKKYRKNIEIGKKLIDGKKFSQFKNISKKKLNSNRSLYVSKKIKRGDKLKIDHVKSVRPGHSLHPKFLGKIIGRKVKKNLSVGSRIKLYDFF